LAGASPRQRRQQLFYSTPECLSRQARRPPACYEGRLAHERARLSAPSSRSQSSARCR
jgi:hypothetical protein